MVRFSLVDIPANSSRMAVTDTLQSSIVSLRESCNAACPFCSTVIAAYMSAVALMCVDLLMRRPTDQLRNFTGAGFALKRGHQIVLASNGNRLPGVVSPIFSEGQALIHGLNWCLQNQFTPQVVFSDCLNLVSKVNGDWQDNSALSGLVSRIRLLFSNFPRASLQYIPRQFNMEAHNLAREALRFRDVS
ncbi:hypothetical protein G4B88_003224 [Cannabis sativa]|uniref:RNase H type-1 domain-containing protein n=1 Tax=Cannabis sativa TaxID=3483 RepID=A0A7J6I447_CANSA|nr:hypothetical protein G4B88_003224 [Cannabis sativa]